MMLNSVLGCLLALQTPQAAPFREQFPLPTAGLGSAWVARIEPETLPPSDELLLRDSGIKWVQKPVLWREIEKTKGTFDWSRCDSDLRQLRRIGVRPILVLTGGNDLYQKGLPTSKEARAGYAAFVRRIALRYRGFGAIWQIWDAPNREAWDPTGSATAYIELAKLAANTVRQTTPEQWIAGPGMVGNDLPFLEQCLTSGLGSSWDLVVVQPDRVEVPEEGQQSIFPLRNLLAQYGLASKPTLLGVDGTDPASQQVRTALAHHTTGTTGTIFQNWKAVASTVKALTASSGFTLKQRISTGNPDEWVLLFMKANQPMVVYWTVGLPRKVSLGDATLDLSKTPQTWVPEKRQRILDLAASLPFVAPVTPVYGREDIEKLVRSVARSAPPATKVIVKLDLPVIGVRRLETSPEDTELERKMDRLGLFLPRADDPIPLSIEIGTAPTLQIATGLLNREPVFVDRVPSPTKTIALRVSGAELDGIGRVTASTPIPDQPLKVKKDDSARIEFPWVRDEPAYVVLESGGRAVWMAEVPGLWTSSAISDAEDAAPNVAVVKSEKVIPIGLPANDQRDGRRIQFSFRQKAEPIALKSPEPDAWPGRPLRYGLWVEGDRSGVKLSLQFVDREGEVFQPESILVTWSGWRFISFSLRCGINQRISGTGDGKPSGPLRLAAPYVLSPWAGRTTSGQITLSNPSISYAKL